MHKRSPVEISVGTPGEILERISEGIEKGGKTQHKLIRKFQVLLELLKVLLEESQKRLMEEFLEELPMENPKEQQKNPQKKKVKFPKEILRKKKILKTWNLKMAATMAASLSSLFQFSRAQT